MNDTALVITIAYAVVVVLGSAAALAIAASTRSRRQADPEAYAHRERNWLLVVLALLVVLLFGTIFFTPYGKSAGENRQIVRVTGVQFAWAIDPARVVAGLPVEFQLQATDVSHGFGVYDEDGVLQFQVQVIPGATQTAVHTFDEPGDYEILCLEFCGRHHHEMVATIRVEAP